MLHPVNQAHHEAADRGARVADAVARGLGSWRFLGIQTAVVALWVGVNLVAVARAWDPYPFILLNLLFSTQAAYTGPVLLLASNRQAAKDRAAIEHDYEVNRRAEAEVRTVLDELRENTAHTLTIVRHLGVEQT